MVTTLPAADEAAIKEHLARAAESLNADQQFIVQQDRVNILVVRGEAQLLRIRVTWRRPFMNDDSSSIIVRPTDPNFEERALDFIKHQYQF